MPRKQSHIFLMHRLQLNKLQLKRLLNNLSIYTGLVYTGLVYIGLVALTLSLAVPAFADEIVKWVDEDGKVHYGDRVPEKYRDKAEEVKVDISVVSPEDDVSNANRMHAQKLKKEDIQEQRRKEREARDKQREAARKASKSNNKTPTLEECRNRYVNRTKLRTECFKRVEEAKAKQK